MDDAVLDGDIGRGNLGPFLRLQLGQHPVADRAVIGLGAARRLADCHRESPHEVRPANDPDELAVAQDRHPFDPVGLQQDGDIGDRSLLGDRQDVARHDVRHLAAVGLDVFTGEFVGRRHHFEPPRAAPLGTGFGAVQQVAFADHADHPVVFIDDRDRAYPVFGQQLCGLRHGCVLTDRNHPVCHDVHRAHLNASCLLSSAVEDGSPLLALRQINSMSQRTAQPLTICASGQAFGPGGTALGTIGMPGSGHC